MKAGDRMLRRELLWLVVVKLLVLYLLWLAFVAPQRVAVSGDSMAGHLVLSSGTPRQSGENHAR